METEFSKQRKDFLSCKMKVTIQEASNEFLSNLRRKKRQILFKNQRKYLWSCEENSMEDLIESKDLDVKKCDILDIMLYSDKEDQIICAVKLLNSVIAQDDEESEEFIDVIYSDKFGELPLINKISELLYSKDIRIVEQTALLLITLIRKKSLILTFENIEEAIQHLYHFRDGSQTLKITLTQNNLTKISLGLKILLEILILSINHLESSSLPLTESNLPYITLKSTLSHLLPMSQILTTQKQSKSTLTGIQTLSSILCNISIISLTPLTSACCSEFIPLVIDLLFKQCNVIEETGHLLKANLLTYLVNHAEYTSEMLSYTTSPTSPTPTLLSNLLPLLTSSSPLITDLTVQLFLTLLPSCSPTDLLEPLWTAIISSLKKEHPLFLQSMTANAIQLIELGLAGPAQVVQVMKKVVAQEEIEAGKGQQTVESKSVLKCFGNWCRNEEWYRAMEEEGIVDEVMEEVSEGLEGEEGEERVLDVLKVLDGVFGVDEERLKIFKEGDGEKRLEKLFDVYKDEDVRSVLISLAGKYFS
ncbi:unnamed protein product [Moneuplotes crassus]|uniref:Uncharacterized protein n=1 Tax=Euplotes crassus TaxID=5936 RepID=A0AAD1UFQ1_EUPCR|nr:unnamed protein product [Moneuplotes crassus]